MAYAEDRGEYFRIPPGGRDLNYAKFVEQGEERITRAGEYTSNNTRLLDVAQMREMLLALPFMQRVLRGEPVLAEY